MRIPLLAVSILSLAATACSAPAASAAPEPQLKTYEVPAGYGAQIQSILNNAMNFAGPDKVVGRAQVTPNGQLVVVAPAAVQDGVKSLLDGLANGPKPAAPPTIEMTYWILDAKRGGAAAKSPELAEIQPALDAIQTADGPLTFKLGEKLRVTSNADEQSSVDGQRAKVWQKIAVRDGKEIIANVNLRSMTSGAQLETDVQIAADRLLVLGQYGEPNEGGSIYYVARAELKSATP